MGQWTGTRKELADALEESGEHLKTPKIGHTYCMRIYGTHAEVRVLAIHGDQIILQRLEQPMFMLLADFMEASRPQVVIAGMSGIDAWYDAKDKSRATNPGDFK